MYSVILFNLVNNNINLDSCQNIFKKFQKISFVTEYLIYFYLYILILLRTNMFKPLLRTLPSLSGNFTIACKLNEIKQDERDEYSTYVRTATLLPLQNSLYTDGIDVNLLNGKYEHDIKKYFYKYSNYFYKENYVYNKKNYKVLDINSKFDNASDSRNKDYEFGCKRISYQQNKYAYSFYAPIYVDDQNDLPEYFVINLQLNDVHTKTIKVYLNKESKINYLGKYIKLYLSKIDSRVIFCLPDSLQATYFGIDIKNGGLTQYKDNIIGYIYKNQTTINNFDKTICDGFERNGLIMRQIIPLSFMFNINDILSDYEKEFFRGFRIKISGYYCTKNDIKYDYYDFDTNYWTSYNKYLKYNERSGEYKLTYGSNNGEYINIMDIGYPSLNEAKYIKYTDFNKTTPNVCKFKMMFSDDKDPYITNLSFAYSYLQNPNQKYGYFPTMYKDIHPNAIIKDNDLVLPLGDNIDKYYKTQKYFANTVYSNSVNFDKYVKLMSNFYGSWFNICDLSDFDNINDIILDKDFSDVQYNYTYFKGILYNLYELQNLNLDKFGVFLSFNMNYIDAINYKNNFIKAKYVLSKTIESEIKINKYNDSYDLGVYSSYLEYKYYSKIVNQLNHDSTDNLLYDKILKNDSKGSYIIDNNFETENTYYDYNDIINLLKTFNELSNIIDDIEKELTISKLTGYLLQNSFNKNNLFIETLKETKKELNLLLYKELFNTNLYNPKYNWLKDLLYVSTESNTSKVLLNSYYNKIQSNENISENILLYLKSSYVHLQDIIVVFEHYVKTNVISLSTFSNIINSINLLPTYINKLYGKINGIEVSNYFVNSIYNSNESKIYIDSYNLNNLIDEYNDVNKSKIKKLSNIKYDFYIKFIDVDHIKEYIYKIHRDENKKSTLLFSINLFKQLYVKKRYWIINENVFDIKDSYVTLYDYLLDTNNYKETTAIDRTLKAANIKTKISLYSNSSLTSLLINSISSSRIKNGCFTFTINDEEFELDLYFNKSVYELNSDIIKIFDNQSSYPYLYVVNNDFIDYTHWQIYDESKNKTLFNITKSLNPLFNNVYSNENDKNTFDEIKKSFTDKYVYTYDSNIYCKEINVLQTVKDILNTKSQRYLDNLTREFLQESKVYSEWNEYIVNIDEYNESTHISILIDFLYTNYQDKYYDIIKELDLRLYSIVNDLTLDMKPIDSLEYDDKFNIYTFDYNGLKYGAYIMQCNIDNTYNSFYINTTLVNANIVFDSINSKSIKNVNNKYFNDIYYLLLPFMKINVFDEFTKFVKTIVYPYESEIVINYYTKELNKNDEAKYKILKNTDDDILYSDLYELGTKKKLKLLRYFNYITPYLVKTTNIKDAWKLKFMQHNDIYEYIEKCNIYERGDININRYDPITLYLGKYINNQFSHSEQIYQIEYKHFNNNVIYNLPESIIVNDAKIYSYNELQNLLSNDNITNKKIEILYKYFKKNKLEYNDIMLFLFNKYESGYEINKVYDSEVLEQCKFNISYKFNLI